MSKEQSSSLRLRTSSTRQSRSGRLICICSMTTSEKSTDSCLVYFRLNRSAVKVLCRNRNKPSPKDAHIRTVDCRRGSCSYTVSTTKVEYPRLCAGSWKRLFQKRTQLLEGPEPFVCSAIDFRSGLIALVPVIRETQLLECPVAHKGWDGRYKINVEMRRSPQEVVHRNVQRPRVTISL